MVHQAGNLSNSSHEKNATTLSHAVGLSIIAMNLCSVPMSTMLRMLTVEARQLPLQRNLSLANPNLVPASVASAAVVAAFDVVAAAAATLAATPVTASTAAAAAPGAALASVVAELHAPLAAVDFATPLPASRSPSL